MSTYAIFGATGKVGLATSVALREAGASVRAIVRDASKASRLSEIGCEIAVADLQDVDSLVKSIGNADVVQIILPPFSRSEDPLQDMRKATECVITALERTHPRRVLAISDYGAHVSSDIGMPTVFRTFERRLSQLDGQKVFLRSAEHMENWALAIPGAVNSGTLPTFLDPVSAPVATISARDVGSLSAELLQLSDDDDGTRVIHTEGPRRYSANDVATTLGEILNRTISVEPIPRSQWANIFQQNMKPSLAELLIKANDAQNKGGLIDVEPGSTEVRHGTTELREVVQGLLGF